MRFQGHNLLAILVAAIAIYAVGFVIYGLAFTDAWVAASGYTEAELLGAPHHILRHPFMPSAAFKDLWDTVGTGSDVRAGYTSTYALAGNADSLGARINLALAAYSLSTATVTSIRDAVNAIPMTANNARQNRTQLAIYLTMTSPEFLVQK